MTDGLVQWLTMAALVSAGASGLLSLAAERRPRLLRQLAFPLLGASGVLCVVVALLSLLGHPGFVLEVPLGLPWLRWHLRLDALSGFFLGVIGLVTAVVSVYGPSYSRHYQQSPYSLAALGLFTGLFVAGMQLVVLADDAFVFLVAWEVMSVASYFLVAYEHHRATNRRAALLYLLMAQIGAVLILLCFGVFAGFSGAFTFASFRSVELAASWADLVFALALAGFGMKAGLVPLHVWLPEAHPVAPSHISALMSGVMLKVAVYGLVRVLFDFHGSPSWIWGVVLLALGSFTALYGVLHALLQSDLKRMLAYCSVENIGTIFVGLGLAATFVGSGFPALGALGLVAALYHCLNHAVFKSLLFLSAGAVLHRGHGGELSLMGGLLRRMPWTGLFCLIGCLSCSALPPFNGFVSEWLTLQTALQATALQSGVLRTLIPVAAAVLALVGAMSAACFVRYYGVAFLGRARSRHARRAREPRQGMLVAQGCLAFLCLVLGVLPTSILSLIGTVPESLLGQGVAPAIQRGWLWLTPVSPAAASFSAPLILFGALLAAAGWFGVQAWLRRGRRRTPPVRVPAWDCGFGGVSAQMQYTAAAFSMPLQQIYQPAWRLEETLVREMDSILPTRADRLEYALSVGDRAWFWFYQPVAQFVAGAARSMARIQTGNLRHYLAYSFVTLLVLLWLIT